MKFLSAKYENFGPFAEAELALNDVGLCLVQGDNQINASADSNGSGKSFLLEGLVFCLFGKTIRGIGPDEVVRNWDKGGKNCCVSVALDNGGQEIEVKRYRAHKDGKNSVQVFVDGIDRTLGTNKETDSFIVDLLGLDYNTFTRSVYFDGSKIVPFPTLTDKEIKEVFEKVLGLEDLSKVGEVIKRRSSGLRSALTLLDSELAMMRSNASTANLEILSAKDRIERWEEERKTTVAAKQQQLNEGLAAGVLPDAHFVEKRAGIEARENKVKEALQRFSQLDQAIAIHQQAVSAMNAEKADLNVQIIKLRNVIANPDKIRAPRELEEVIASLNADVKRTQAAIVDFDYTLSNAEHKIGTACNECGKTYEAGDLSAIIEHAKKHKASAQNVCDTFQRSLVEKQDEVKAHVASEIAAAKELLRALEAKIDSDFLERGEDLNKQKETLDDLVRQRAEASAGLSTFASEYAALEREREQNRRIAASLNALEKEIEALGKKPNPYFADVERWEQRKAEAEREVAQREASATEMRGTAEILSFLEKAYGRTGLKAHILEVVTPVLNQRANEYALRLADGTVSIDFSTVTKNKDGSLAERFSVNVQNGQGAEGYLSNSSGERKKIDLAIALALSDLVSARSNRPIDLWVADEIAENLDSTAQERVVELLQDKANERGSLLVISHTDMRSWIPNVITVQKTAAGSKIV